MSLLRFADAPGKVAVTDVTAHCVSEPVGKGPYLIVTVKTDAGITGIGETAAWPDPHTAIARIMTMKPALIGNDATAAEVVRQALLNAAGERKSDAAPVLAAVNMALLDILGKLAKAPTYEVLGGPTRNKVRALACIEGETEGQLKEQVRQASQAGFRAFSVPVLLPDGPTRGRTFFRKTVRLLESLRETAGEGSDFVLDAGGRLTPAEAAGLAKALESFHLLWLDEPVGDIDRKRIRDISAESVTPLGTGRSITDNRDYLGLLPHDALDVLRPDVTLNGITAIRKAAALAETYYVAVAPYHRAGPIATAAGLHIAASIPNGFILDVPFPADERVRKMRRDLAGDEIEAVKDGYLALPSGPGLGISLNEDVLRKYQVR